MSENAQAAKELVRKWFPDEPAPCILTRAASITALLDAREGEVVRACAEIIATYRDEDGWERRCQRKIRERVLAAYPAAFREEA